MALHSEHPPVLRKQYLVLRDLRAGPCREQLRQHRHLIPVRAVDQDLLLQPEVSEAVPAQQLLAEVHDAVADVVVAPLLLAQPRRFDLPVEGLAQDLKSEADSQELDVLVLLVDSHQEPLQAANPLFVVVRAARAPGDDDGLGVCEGLFVGVLALGDRVDEPLLLLAAVEAVEEADGVDVDLRRAEAAEVVVFEVEEEVFGLDFEVLAAEDDPIERVFPVQLGEVEVWEEGEVLFR